MRRCCHRIIFVEKTLRIIQSFLPNCIFRGPRLHPQLLLPSPTHQPHGSRTAAAPGWTFSRRRPGRTQPPCSSSPCCLTRGRCGERGREGCGTHSPGADNGPRGQRRPSPQVPALRSDAEQPTGPGRRRGLSGAAAAERAGRGPAGSQRPPAGGRTRACRETQTAATASERREEARPLPGAPARCPVPPAAARCRSLPPHSGRGGPVRSRPRVTPARPARRRRCQRKLRPFRRRACPAPQPGPAVRWRRRPSAM